MAGFRFYSLWLACCFVFGFSGAASAQWLFEKKPDVNGSALEVSRQIPRDARLVFGFDLKGQIDMLGLVDDVKASMKKSPGGREDFAKLEKELGLSLHEWLDLFSGAGYFSILEPKSKQELSEGKGLILGLRLKRPKAFRTWLEPKFDKETIIRSSGNFTIWEISDGVQFAVGSGWFLIASDKSASARQMGTLSGAETALYTEPRFTSAVSSLTGGDSGLFFYLDGPTVRRIAIDIAGVTSDHPVVEKLGFWDSGILSIDFQSEQSDGFLAYSDGVGPTLEALRAPGSVNRTLIDLVPAGQSTFSVADARWLANVVTAFGQDVPDIGFLLTLAQGQLNGYGDLGEAFLGTVVVASNSMEYLAQSLKDDLSRSRSSGPFVACKTNLKSIATACEMWSTDYSGKYPERLDQLTPDYLRAMPTCPASHLEYTYEALQEEGYDSYRIVCTGHAHPETEADHPQYSGMVGLIEGETQKLTTGTEDEVSASKDMSKPSIYVAMPVKSIQVAHELMTNAVEANKVSEVDGGPPTDIGNSRPSAPGARETRRYEVKDGPKAVLDPDRNLMTLAYGPNAEALLQAPSGQVAHHPSVERALRWGEGRVVYLDYFNVEPIYQAGLALLEQAVDDGEDEAQVLLDLVRKTRGRLGKLEGVSAVRTTDAGLHYRSTGLGSSQMLTVFGLGGAILVPNFVRAKSQGQLTACKSNLKNIGTACEMFSTDHDGEYPHSMDQLTPDYFRTIPQCPEAGEDTYSASYRRMTPEESGVPYGSFEAYCQGHFHEKDGLTEDFPRYNGIEGLIERSIEQ